MTGSIMPAAELTLWEKVRLAREGSAVERCHVFPHLMRYSVGHHSYDMAMLVIICWQADHEEALPPAELLVRVLLHDQGERVTGDLPSQVKTLMGQPLYAIDQAWEKALLGPYARGACHLDPEQQDYLYAADHLELCLWAHEEVLVRGNQTFANWLPGLRQLPGQAPASMRSLANQALRQYSDLPGHLEWPFVKRIAGL